MAGRMDDLGGYHDDVESPAPDAGLSAGVIHTKEQELDIRRKAASGEMIGNDSLDYLGHFADDKVTGQGHNVGHKPKGEAHFTGIAKKGFRKIAGSASPFAGAAQPFERSMAEDGMAPTPRHNPPRKPKPDGAKMKMPRMRAMSAVAFKPKPMEVVIVGRKKK